MQEEIEINWQETKKIEESLEKIEIEKKHVSSLINDCFDFIHYKKKLLTDLSHHQLSEKDRDDLEMIGYQYNKSFGLLSQHFEERLEGLRKKESHFEQKRDELYYQRQRLMATNNDNMGKEKPFNG